MEFTCRRGELTKVYTLDPTTDTVEDLLVLSSIDFSIPLEDIAVRHGHCTAWTLDKGFSLLQEMLAAFLGDPFPFPCSIELQVSNRATANKLDETAKRIASLFSSPPNPATSILANRRGGGRGGGEEGDPYLPLTTTTTTNTSSGGGSTSAAGPADPPSVPPPHWDFPSSPFFQEEEMEAQRRLFDAIQQQNIDENLRTAFELTPESFTPVTMLYVHCSIQGVPLKAFVDSGAQQSFMNVKTAERCHLLRLVDKRMGGTALGVGQQKILGRIHMVEVQLNDGAVLVPFSFSVLQNQVMDIIFGLDQLRRHQCCIDLKSNCLRFGQYEGVQISFLHEHELQEEMKALIAARIPDDDDGSGAEKNNEEEGEKNKEMKKQGSISPSLPPPSPSSAKEEGETTTNAIIGEKHPRMLSPVCRERTTTPPRPAIEEVVAPAGNGGPEGGSSSSSTYDRSGSRTSPRKRPSEHRCKTTATSTPPPPPPPLTASVTPPSSSSSFSSLTPAQAKKLQSIIEMSGAEPEEALTFLTIAEWNVETAITLIFGE